MEEKEEWKEEEEEEEKGGRSGTERDPFFSVWHPACCSTSSMGSLNHEINIYVGTV